MDTLLSQGDFLSILITPKQPKKVVIKSRGRIYGKKATYDEIQAEIVKLVQQGIPISSIDPNVTTISKLTGKSRQTINRYLNKAIKEGILQRTSEKKFELSKQVQAQLTHQYLSKDNFVEKYPVVKNWVEKREREALGNKRKLDNVREQLNQLKIVCDTLELNPYSLLAEKDGSKYGGLAEAMQLFKNALVNGTVKYLQKQKKQSEQEDDNVDSKFRTYLMACRNFCMYNGIAIPKLPKTHILSGKKINFGTYAHVRLSFTKIDQIVQYLKNQYGEQSRELAMFIFYYLTGTRRDSIYKIQTSSIQQRLDGWLECRVYESKTKQEWRKLIPNDNPHFDILKNYMLNRVKQGARYLFVDSEKEITRKLKDYITSVFKQAYTQAKITEPYFIMRPTHALRHVAAHYWIDRTNQNYVAVAKICGWKDVQTLIACYGEISDEQIISIVARSNFKHD